MTTHHNEADCALVALQWKKASVAAPVLHAAENHFSFFLNEHDIGGVKYSFTGTFCVLFFDVGGGGVHSEGSVSFCNPHHNR